MITARPGATSAPLSAVVQKQETSLNVAGFAYGASKSPPLASEIRTVTFRVSEAVARHFGIVHTPARHITPGEQSLVSRHSTQVRL
jgi:hypothetical protein